MFKPNKHRDTAQRFTIKKFKFGAASVLIGTVFAVFAGGVQAEGQEGTVEPVTPPSSTTVVTETPQISEPTVASDSESSAPQGTASSAAVESSQVAVEAVSQEASSTVSSTASSSSVEATSEVTKSEEAKSEVATSESAKSEASQSASTAPSSAPVVESKSSTATAQPAPQAPVTRVAATTYKVTYTDLATGEVVYTTPTKTVSEETTLPKSEAVSFNLSVKNELVTAPDLKGYKLAEGQAAVQAAVVVERGGKKNLVNFNVVRDDVAAAAGPDETDSYVGFRAAIDPVDVTVPGGSSTLSRDKNGFQAPYTVVVKSYQGTTDAAATPPINRPGYTGRLDAPLTAEEARKLAAEAPLWTGKVRPTGTNLGTTVYGGRGAYEFLATEIYRNVYEQGKDYIYIENAKGQFDLTEESKAAGYRITSIDITNLIPGLAYNPNTDTIEGYTVAWIQNGVQEKRITLRVADANGATTNFVLDGLVPGWLGWTDTTAPKVEARSATYTVGDTITHSIGMTDNDTVASDDRTNYTLSNGVRLQGGTRTGYQGREEGYNAPATFTAKDGTVLTTGSNPRPATSVTGVAGVTGASTTPIESLIPGTRYTPTTGNITGTLTQAGIYTLTPYSKDYSLNARNDQWTMYGQETNENMTIGVKPTVSIENVEAYATEVPVTIANGTNQAKITMPDGTVTNLVLENNNWVVSADGTTNTAVSAGQTLGAAGSKFNLPVTSDATQYAGVDTIAVEAIVENVTAVIPRKDITVTDSVGVSMVASLNKATGKYELPADQAFIVTDNGNGTSTIKERRIYNNDTADGTNEYIVYEFTRTYNTTSSASSLEEKIREIRENGTVTAVNEVTRTTTPGVKGFLQVAYNANTKTWTATDGSTVTATEDGEGWSVETDSGFKGYVAIRKLVATDLASIHNQKPESSSSSYDTTRQLTPTVDLLKAAPAAVTISDKEDDASNDTQSETLVTSVKVVTPDGNETVIASAKAEEAAFISAERQAAKAQAAVAAEISNAMSSQLSLALAEEKVRRLERYVADAEAAIPVAQKRDTARVRVPEAEALLEDYRAKLAEAQAEVTAAQAALNVSTNKLTPLKAAAEAANAVVEETRNALKAASEAIPAKVAAFALSQSGEYQVTVTAVDSNGIVTTPTAGGTDSGEVTEDAVTSTTYKIIVHELVAKPEYTAGLAGVTQTDSMSDNFTSKSTEASISNYTFIDPADNTEKTEVTVAGQGTYTIDATSGEVTFTPVDGFIGTATAIKVKATAQASGANGQPFDFSETTTYTPVVYDLVPENKTSRDIQGKTQTGQPTFKSANTEANTTNVDGTDQDESKVTIPETGAYSLENANGEGKVVIPGEGTYSINSDTGLVTFVPEPGFTGPGTGVTVKVVGLVTDAENNVLEVPKTATYTPTVDPITAEGTDKETSGKQGQVQSGTPSFTVSDESATLSGYKLEGADEEGKVVVPSEGTYTVDPQTGKVTFTPEPGFTGPGTGVTVKATYVVTNENGEEAEVTATATYTPTVTPITPTAEPRETSGPQGKAQKTDAKTMFTEGDEVAPIDNSTITLLDAEGNPTKTVTVENEGTYTLNDDGIITFQPETSFVGKGQGVRVQAADKNGTKVSDTYTPTVTDVTMSSENAVSRKKQGETQSGTPSFTTSDPSVTITGYKLEGADEEGKVVVPGEGTYTVDPQTGKVTFVPEPGFTGPGTGVTVTATDSNGETATATYTPTVDPITAEGTDKETSGKQGQVQSGTPNFTVSDESATLSGYKLEGADEEGKVVVPDEGTYTVDPQTGKVTFTPEPGFTGPGTGVTVKATYVVTNENGEEAEVTATATYTPTVTPITPTAEPRETSGPQGKAQKTDAKTMFTEGDEVAPIDNSTITLLDAEGNPTKTVTVENEGTYTLNDDGTITFQPEPSFVGRAGGVTVRAADKNGTTVSDKYTPTVTDVTMTSENATSRKKQGETQTGTPTFETSDPSVTITGYELDGADEEGKVVIPGEGTYTVDPTTGKVTFTPEPGFTGPGTGVTVVATDSNGEENTATYTPNVTPITAEGVDKETTGKQGQPQSGTPTFSVSDESASLSGYKLQGADDEGKVVVPGEGTYTIDPTTGKVTFTPDPGFTGPGTGVTVEATYKVTNANGETADVTATATYTPNVTPITPTAEPRETSGPQGQTQKTDATSMFTEGDEVAPIDKSTITLLDSEGNPTKTVTVDGEGTYTLNDDGTITFTPEPSFTGKGQGVLVRAADTNGTQVEDRYTPNVTDVTMTSEPATSTKKQGETQTGTPRFETSDPSVTITGYKLQGADDEGKVVVPGEGTYTVDPTTGKVTFVPDPGFTGPGTGVTVVATDSNGEENTATYTPNVTPITAEGVDKETTGKQGQPQSGTPTFSVSDESASLSGYKLQGADDEGKVVVPGEGTYTIDPTTGKVTFTPDPGFTGPGTGVTVEATYKVTNANGETADVTATATYTPNVTPITPTAEPRETSGPQGQTQKTDATSMFTEGDEVAPIDKSTITLLDSEGNPTKTVTVDGEGTYTLNDDGTITFTPEPSFTGKGQGVLVRAADTNGTQVEDRYTPNVTDVTMTSEPATSTKKQGETQTGTPRFETSDPSVTITGYKLQGADDEGKVVVPGEGTYTVDPTTGKVTFVPDPGFTGPGTGVTVVATDSNGEENTATYTPNVTPITAEGVDKETTGKQGQPQSGTPTFSVSDESASLSGYKLQGADDEGKVVVPGEGTYTIDPTTGKVTFTPDPGFTGPGTGVTVEATYKVTNANGETADVTATATYTPNVTPVNTTFVDQDGNPLAPGEEGKQPSKDIPGYELVSSTTDENDNVVHVYRPKARTNTSFVDENGNPLSPNEEGNQPSKSIPDYELVSSTTDENGNTVHVYRKVSKPSTSFVDENGEPIAPSEDGKQPSKDIPGYEITGSTTDKDGNVIHTYRKVAKTTTSFVDENGEPIAPSEDGKQPSKDIPGYEITGSTTDKDGNVIHTYRKVAKTTTSFVDENGNPLSPNEEGNQPSKSIPDYELVSSTTDENGNTVHVYRKVSKPSTSFVDENGEPIAPSEDGKQPSKDIPGYEITGSTTDKDGNVIHTYRKVAKTTTSFVDENGNPLSPNEEGNQPSKSIPDYELVSSTTDENGNTVHVYRKVSKPSTSFVDENGNPLSPNEEGNQPSKSIPDYELVSSTTDENGNTVHVYRKVSKPSTSFVDENGEPIAPNEDGKQPSKDIPGYEITGSTTDKDGNVIHTYRKVSKPSTSFVDENGNPLSPNEEGNQPSKSIPDYELVSSTTDENGNTVHVYRKVSKPSTSFVDENGNPLSPNEEGNQPSKSIPDYELVSSTTDENGNTVHVYRKVSKPSTSFVDENGEPIAPSEDGKQPSKDIPGYEITGSTTDKDGNVIHTYRKVAKTTTSFVDENGNPLSPNEEGNQPSKSIPDYELVSSTTDENGNTVHVYRKVSKPTTSFVDENGEPIAPSEDGKQPSKDIPGYEITGSTTDKDGNVIHTYRKVAKTTTSFVDENGNPLSPNEEGNQPSKSIPDYELVSSTTDENGNTVHVYRKVSKPSTSFVDENGEPIAPSEDGKQPSKDIPGYEITGSTTDKDGNVIHTYRKVAKTTTSFVDENGNPLSPNEEGNQPSKSIPDYELVSSTTDENGNTVHVYRKVSKPTTSFVDENGEPIAPSEDGKQPSKDIPGYEITGSTTDKDGNVIHTYRKVAKTTTSFVDENGNPLSPNEEGNQPSKSIPDYELVSSTTDENGNTVHVYRKVSKPSTSFVDENGEPIAPSEDGKQPSKDIPGYEITGSTTDKDGNVIHTYRKVAKTTTSFVDENGNPLSPNEEGNQPSKSIPDYELVSSTTDENGNTVHVYRKVSKPTTSFVDENGEPIAPSEDGKQPSKDIPGYEITGSTTDKDGNVIHTYRKVAKTTTSFVDENGNPLSPNEEGNQPSKSIPDYELVSSTTDENGNTVHVYRKVVKPVAPTQPVKPAQPAKQTPASPVVPVAPQASAQPAEGKPAAKTENKLEVLPNTGTENTATASALGVGMILTALGLAGKRRRKED